MTYNSRDLKSQISQLGILSRPLGEVRAGQLGRELTYEIASAVALGGDVAPILARFRQEILRELEVRSPRVRTIDSKNNIANFLPVFSMAELYQS